MVYQIKIYAQKRGEKLSSNAPVKQKEFIEAFKSDPNISICNVSNVVMLGIAILLYKKLYIN